MKKAISKLAASVAIASLPMTGIASATLVLSADIAIAAGKSGDKGKSADKGKGKSGDKSTGKPETANKGSEASARKGLNSLRRNINGLMNSSDPKMEGFRSFVLANAALSEATDLLALAQGEFDAAQADYDSLELSGTASDDLSALQAELDGLVEPDPDTATQEEIDAHNAAVESLTASIQVVETYLIEADELAVAVQGVQTRLLEPLKKTSCKPLSTRCTLPVRPILQSMTLPKICSSYSRSIWIAIQAKPLKFSGEGDQRLVAFFMSSTRVARR